MTFHDFSTVATMHVFDLKSCFSFVCFLLNSGKSTGVLDQFGVLTLNYSY